MARKRASEESAAKAVTPERAARLYRLLKILAKGPQKRLPLLRQLKLDVRGFYRDLELLRISQIDVSHGEDGRYHLKEDADAAIDRLPFPDPHFTLGEAIQVSKGRSKAHQKLRKQVGRIVKK